MRYKALRMIARDFKFLGWGVGIIGSIISLIIFVSGFYQGTRGVGIFFLSVGIGLLTVIIGLSLFAVAEGILVWLDIEDHTRRGTEFLEKLANTMTSAQDAESADSP